MDNMDLLTNEETEVVNNEEISRLEQIEIELQELEIVLDQLDLKITNEGETEDLYNQYQNSKEKYKELLIERKKLLKEKNTNLDKIPVWMIIFALIQFIIFFPIASYYLWIAFANWMIGVLDKPLDIVSQNGSDFLFNVMTVLIVYALPLINFFSTWTIYVNYNKNQYAKKILKWIWIIQSGLTLIMVIYLYFTLLKDVML